MIEEAFQPPVVPVLAWDLLSASVPPPEPFTLLHPSLLTSLTGPSSTLNSYLSLRAIIQYLAVHPSSRATYISTLSSFPSIPETTPAKVLDRLFLVQAFDVEGVSDALSEALQSGSKAIVVDTISLIMRAEYLRRGVTQGEEVLREICGGVRGKNCAVLFVNDATAAKSDGKPGLGSGLTSMFVENSRYRAALGPMFMGEMDVVYWATAGPDNSVILEVVADTYDGREGQWKKVPLEENLA